MARRPRRITTTPAQIQNKINSILDNYHHDTNHTAMEILCHRRTNYRNGNKNQINRRADLDYNKIIRLKAKLRQVPIVNTTICDNCKRQQSNYLIEKYSIDSPYHIQFINQNSSNIGSRKFKHTSLLSSRNSNSLEYLLCNPCNQHLTNPTDYTTDAFCWPSFLLSLLENKSLHDHYGSTYLWRFIPTEYRYWWIDYIKLNFPNDFIDISIEYPKPFFNDITMDIVDWEKGINSGELTELARICNDYILPTIMCPWGDSVFPHHFGSISIDIIIQRKLQHCEIKLINNKNLNKVKWSRDDYLRDDSDNDCWMMNPLFQVNPTIACIDGTMKVLTCKDHHCGNNHIMIHPCRWKHQLCSDQPDQIAQVVTQSRIVRKGKASLYTTEWQMMQQHGFFGGLDTCNHVEFGNFQKRSIIRYENESKAVANRLDINIHLDTLCNEKIISSETVKSIRDKATQFKNETDIKPYTYGATFVPYKVAIALQECTRDRIISLRVLDHNNQNGIIVKFQRYIPLFIYPCQVYSNHGVQMLLIPRFSRGPQNKALWQLSTILLQVEKVWQIFNTSLKNNNDWFGWLLVFLTNRCLHRTKSQGRKDPFKNKFVKTINNLKNKIPIHQTFYQYLNEFKDISIFEVNDTDQDFIGTTFYNNQQFINSIDECEVLIISMNQPLDNDTDDQSITTLSQITIENLNFELRCQIITTNTDHEGRWKGEVYSRHGTDFNLYWYQHNLSQYPIKKERRELLKTGEEFILVYVRSDHEDDLNSTRNQYLRLIGGQSHIQCREHRCPLVASYEKNLKCNCLKNAKYRCSIDHCNTKICQNCFNAFDSNIINYIPNSTTTTNDNDNENNLHNDETSHSDTSSSNHSFVYNNEEYNDIPQPTNEEINLDNFVITSNDHEINVDDLDMLLDLDNSDTDEDDDTFIHSEFIPTTNAGEVPTQVIEKVKYGFKFSGCNILNNVGALMTRNHYDIKGSRYVNYHMQKLVSVAKCKSIPLLYPEGILFPSHHYKSTHDNCSIIGAIPSSLLNSYCTQEGFTTIQQCIRTRLTSPINSMSSDPRYISHCYDVMANLAASHNDTRMIINRGLTISDDNDGNLGVRGCGDSSILGSIDSKQMVKNLCTSQKHISWSYFLTFTANQSRHFGTKIIRKWLEDKGWQNIYPNYHDMTSDDQIEIDNAMNQTASGLMLRVWEEVSKLFLDFLTKSPHSPYKNVKALFSRREYQSNSGNLAHAHIILAVDWDQLDDNQRHFVKNLGRASVFDTVRSNEIPDYIRRKIISNPDDVHSKVNDAVTFLSHHCSNRCKVPSPITKELKCRFPKYLHMTTDNTRPMFMEMPINITQQCWECLSDLGLSNSIFDEHGKENKFKCSLEFFHPKRWIPAVVPGECLISPFESETFCTCQSQQNVQPLFDATGCCKYCCKYVAKIDEQNRIDISMNNQKKGSFASNSTYLHNTKITSSDIIQKDKLTSDKRTTNHPQGRCIALTEMLHVMLKYPEVYTDLKFVSICTMPLELRVSKKINIDSETNDDGFFINSVSDQVRSNKPLLPNWRQHSINDKLLMNDIKQSGLSVDKVTQFSLRPPELRGTIDMVGNYFRWFHIIMQKKINSEEMDTIIHIDLKKTWWVDGLQRQVKLRKEAITELLKWCDTIQEDDSFNIPDNSHLREMVSIFHDISNVLLHPFEELDNHNQIFYQHIQDNIIHQDTIIQHLPIPVYSMLTPTMSLQFLNHIMLSLGRYESEMDLSLFGTIREKYRHAKLIGPNDDEISLQIYANELCVRYIKEQICIYPKSMNIIQTYIVEASRLFNSVIVNDEIPSSDLPPVHYSILMRSMKDKAIENRRIVKSKFIDASLIEMGNEMININNIPTKEQLMNATLENPCNWDAYNSMTQSSIQSEESFLEQKFAIKVCKQSIDTHCHMTNQTTLTKSVVIRGTPGAGKTFCMVYMALYSISKGLFCTAAARMCHRSLQMGTQHWHSILGLPGNEDKVSNPYRRAELAVARMKRRPLSEDFVKSLHIIFADELGQLSAEDITVFDYILRQVRCSNLFMGGILLIGSLDHKQIQPIDGRPFLLAHSVIPCIKTVALKHCVRATGNDYVELQSIIRKDYNEFDSNPELVQHFRDICSNIFTFVDNWDDEKITNETYRVFSKKFPGREALQIFQNRLCRKYNSNPSGNLRKRVSIDLQKSKIGHDWRTAGSDTSKILDQKFKENHTLYFEIGLIYQCTYNDSIKSSTQKALLFDLPDQQELDNFRPIKILLAPPGCKEVRFITDATKQYYFDKGFIETTASCNTRTKIYNLPGNMQGQRKQYGLNHYVAGTIHSAMGDTLPSVATSLSKSDNNYSMWDKGQLLVILSRTKLAKDTILVGNKEDTLDALEDLLKTRTQWTQYMEQILKIITTNPNSIEDIDANEAYEGGLDQSFFPYRICDISLPPDNSGYVYMLISTRKQDFVYIGKTLDLNTRLRSHNSGHGSRTSQPLHLRPYSFFAYICGFNGNESLMYYIEQKWKNNIARLISQGEQRPHQWARRGGNELMNCDLSNYGITDTRSELRLILLFKD